MLRTCPCLHRRIQHPCQMSVTSGFTTFTTWERPWWFSHVFSEAAVSFFAFSMLVAWCCYRRVTGCRSTEHDRVRRGRAEGIVELREFGKSTWQPMWIVQAEQRESQWFDVCHSIGNRDVSKLVWDVAVGYIKQFQSCWVKSWWCLWPTPLSRRDLVVQDSVHLETMKRSNLITL